MKVFTLPAAAFALLTANAALAKAPPPAAGNYPCYTYQVSQQLHDRQRTSVATLETDWRMVYERSTDIVPAGISLSLDGKNGYRVVGTRARGTYSYSAATGQVSFAGEANQLKLRSYFVKNGLYIFQFQPDPDVFYHCEYNSGNRQIGSTGAQQQTTGPRQNGPAGNVARPRNPRPMTANDVNGRFEGSYVCSIEGETRLRLDLQASPSGRMTGTLTFGGTNGAPVGSYTVRGLWSAQSFFLSAGEWIDHPDGYVMANINGYLAQGGGLAGEMVYQGCTGFNVTRK
jgi:hypothetical protein